MLCCVCKEKEATVHLTQIVGNKMHKVDLCEECAREKGLEDPSGFAFSDLLLGLGASQEIEQAAATAGEPACPQCGYTHADFKKAGRLGCPECYQTFADVLRELLKNMHKGVQHVGKTPRRQQPVMDLGERLRRLRQQLEKAIAEENFEEAARVRDEIKRTTEEAAQVPTA